MDTRRLLEEFPAYLEANRLARPQHIPFLRRWAERYLSAPADPTLGPDDRLRTFLTVLGQTPGVAAWQVSQAEDAVRLLRQSARERPSTPSGVLPLPPVAARGDAPEAPEGRGAPALTTAWAEALADERKLLRLRHYSPKTETGVSGLGAALCRVLRPTARHRALRQRGQGQRDLAAAGLGGTPAGASGPGEGTP